MDLSVIIPLYNSEGTIRECVLSILNSELDKDFEVIVVDDGSSDGSIAKIKDLNIKILRQENKGAATAKNVGAREAKSNILLFADSDTIFFKDTLKRIYGHLKKDDVDFVTGIYSRTPLNDKWIHRYRALADYSYYYDFIFTEEEKERPIRGVIIGGGIEGYKRKVFEELGGFDERVKGAGVEEEKLIAKLLGHYNLLADSKIVTRHNFPNFVKLTKDYFNRTFQVMGIMHNEDYSQPYLAKNRLRVFLGASTVASLVFSLIFQHPFFFVIALIFFISYLALHWRMFVTAFKDYGFLFMLYVLVTNLYFCSVIALAGFLGTVRSLLRR